MQRVHVVGGVIFTVLYQVDQRVVIRQELGHLVDSVSCDHENILRFHTGGQISVDLPLQNWSTSSADQALGSITGD